MGWGNKLNGRRNNCPKCKEGSLRKWIENKKDSSGVIIRHETYKCDKCGFRNIKKVNTGINQRDIDNAIRTGVCPGCHKSGFKSVIGGGYNTDSGGKIVVTKDYDCDKCDFYCTKTVNTGVTEKDLKEATDILKKHGLLEVSEEYMNALNMERCLACGNKDWKRFDKEKEEIHCKHDGLVLSKYPYPGYDDTEDVKKIIKNKDSKEELMKIIPPEEHIPEPEKYTPFQKTAMISFVILMVAGFIIFGFTTKRWMLFGFGVGALILLLFGSKDEWF